MRIIMFRHHRHLHKINMKLFFTLTNVSQWYLVPHNCLQRNIDARYLIYVTKIKGSRVQAPIGKYLSLKDFRKSITTSISNISLQKNHSSTIELTYPTGRKCRILEPSDFFYQSPEQRGMRILQTNFLFSAWERTFFFHSVVC